MIKDNNNNCILKEGSTKKGYESSDFVLKHSVSKFYPLN